MSEQRNVALIGAFLMDGLRSTITAHHNLLDEWGQGYLELVYELCLYAEYIELKYQENYNFDFPGVFDYEVTSPFGTWFGDYIHAHPLHDSPTETASRAKIDELVKNFFERGVKV